MRLLKDRESTFPWLSGGDDTSFYKYTAFIELSKDAGVKNAMGSRLFEALIPKSDQYVVEVTEREIWQDNRELFDFIIPRLVENPEHYRDGAFCTMVFDRNERLLCQAIVKLLMTNIWGARVGSLDRRTYFYFSHDEYVEIYTSSVAVAKKLERHFDQEGLTMTKLGQSVAFRE